MVKITNVTTAMVDHFNLRMESEGSCLRYIDTSRDGDVIAYEIMVKDKYINNEYRTNLQLTKEFEEMVKKFFNKYNVKHTGYSNTVATIFAYDK